MSLNPFATQGARAVVITSLFCCDPAFIYLLGSAPFAAACDSRFAQSAAARGATHVKFTIKLPRLARSFTGTGDLIAALLLAFTLKHPRDFVLATEKATAAVQVRAQML